MPTPKDMEFAKLLIGKQLVSRAEMQRHLDDLDALRKSGQKIELEDLALKRGVISAEELRFIRGPKKRIVHCNKCNTMYRVEDEDIGKKFKCKKCGIFVIVPLPGQTPVRPAREIPNAPGPKAEIDAQKIIRKISPAKAGQASPPLIKPTVQEVTMLLGLDDEEEDVDRPATHSPAAEKASAQTGRTPPRDDDETEMDKKMERWVLTGEVGEGAEVIPVETRVPQPKPEEESIEEVPEELDEWAVSGYGGEGAENVEVKTDVPTKKSPEVEVPEELDEWAVSGYGGEGAEDVEVKTKIEDTAVRPEVPLLTPREKEALAQWADATAKQRPDKPRASEAGGKEAIPPGPAHIATPVKGDSQKKPPTKESEMTIVLGLDDEDEETEI